MFVILMSFILGIISYILIDIAKDNEYPFVVSMLAGFFCLLTIIGVLLSLFEIYRVIVVWI